MPAFKRLYLDTNILRSSRWPSVSARLAGIVELAKNFGVRILIPQAVEDEREAQWIRDVGKAYDGLKKPTKELSGQLAVIADAVAMPPKPDFENLREQYRAASVRARGNLGIDLAPTTARTAGELFQFAIRHKAPFKEVGGHVTGFQDAVIFFSAVDDTRQSGEPICALFSEDDDFVKAAPLATLSGITFEHFGSHDKMWRAFADEITPSLSAWWSKDRQAAEEAIDRSRSSIEAFLLKETAPESVGGLVKEIVAAKIAFIVAVETPLLQPLPNFPGPYQRVAGSVITVTCNLLVMFDVLDVVGITMESLLLARLLRQLPEAMDPPSGTRSQELQKELITKSVELECKGAFNGEEYELSEYRVVNLSSSIGSESPPISAR